MRPNCIIGEHRKRGGQLNPPNFVEANCYDLDELLGNIFGRAMMLPDHSKNQEVNKRVNALVWESIQAFKDRFELFEATAKQRLLV